MRSNVGNGERGSHGLISPGRSSYAAKDRERSIAMLTKWNKLLGNEPADANRKKDEPAANGVQKKKGHSDG